MKLVNANASERKLSDDVPAKNAAVKRKKTPKKSCNKKQKKNVVESNDAVETPNKVNNNNITLESVDFLRGVVKVSYLKVFSQTYFSVQELQNHLDFRYQDWR